MTNTPNGKAPPDKPVTGAAAARAFVASYEWKDIVARARIIHAESRWRLGDLALAVASSRKYGDHKVRLLADELGIQYKTLANYMRVAKAYPVEKSNRFDHLWTVYEVFAGRSDRFKLTAPDLHWTVAKARAKVAPEPQPPTLAEPSPAQLPPSPDYDATGLPVRPGPRPVTINEALDDDHEQAGEDVPADELLGRDWPAEAAAGAHELDGWAARLGQIVGSAPPSSVTAEVTGWRSQVTSGLKHLADDWLRREASGESEPEPSDGSKASVGLSG